MNRLILAALVVLVFGCGGSAPDKAVAAESRLSLKLEPDGKTFAKGSPVVLTATVTNTSGNAIRIPNGGAWRGGFRFGLTIEVADEKGLRYEPIPLPMAHRPITRDDFVVLVPGKELRIEFDIGEFTLRTPEWKIGQRIDLRAGDYVVRAKFANAHKGWPEGDRWELKAAPDMWLGETPWAEIAIHVR